MASTTRRLIAVLLLGLCLPFAISALLGRDRSKAEAGAATDLFLKQPYLIFTGDRTKMEVLWQLTATAASTLAWGPDTTCSLGNTVTTEYGADHQHSYVIPDLTPATFYDYKVTAEGTTYRGSFQTAPDSSAQNVRFFVYGDTRTNGSVHNQIAGAMLAKLTADPSWQTFALVVGDLVYSGQTESDWTNQFFNPAYTNIRGFMARMPYLSCIGNHEGDGLLFQKYFPYPDVAGRYWSFDYGPVHVAIVDQYTSYTPGSPQLTWLANDLATSNKEWKIICLHEPGWSAGYHENVLAVQYYIQPLCEQYGVSLVFGGHNHYYSRAVFNYVQHVTTGGGGAPLYVPNLTYPFVVAGSSSYHYCEVDITPDALSFKAYKADGTLIDSFTRTPTGVPEPVEQGALAPARPNPFRYETVIDWWPNGGSRPTMYIVDASGRVVRQFEAAGSGRQVVRWDGRDNAGRLVASGTYFAKFESGGRTQKRKIVLAR